MLDARLDAAALGDVFQRRGPAAVRRALVDQPDHASVGHRDHGVLGLVALRIEEFLRNRSRRRRRRSRSACDAGSDRADGSRASPRRATPRTCRCSAGCRAPAGRCASNSSRPWVMLSTAVSRCWLFSDSSACAARCWRCSWRTIRKMMTTTTTTASTAAKNCSRVCARQSASAVSVLVAAMITIGKWSSVRAAPIRSSSRHLADEASGHVAAGIHRAAERRIGRDVLADELGILRIARDHRAVVMDHRDRGVGIERKRGRRNPRNGSARRRGWQSRSACRRGRRSCGRTPSSTFPSPC